MSKIILVGCPDSLAARIDMEEVECITHEEATLRGLTETTPVVPLTLEFRAPPQLPPTPILIPRKENTHHHGYPGKRRGRRQY